MGLDHQRLDVYRHALALLKLCDETIQHLPKGRGQIKEQLESAATSVVANVAEGAGEFSGEEKARFYRMARRSGDRDRSLSRHRSSSRSAGAAHPTRSARARDRRADASQASPNLRALSQPTARPLSRAPPRTLKPALALARFSVTPAPVQGQEKVETLAPKPALPSPSIGPLRQAVREPQRKR